MRYFRSLALVSALAVVLIGVAFVAFPQTAAALDDEPPPVAMTIDNFVTLAPGDLACTGTVFVASTARISYELRAQGTPNHNAKLTLRSNPGPAETVVFFSRIEANTTGPGILTLVDVPVSAGNFRACVRNPSTSGVTMSLRGRLDSI